MDGTAKAVSSTSIAVSDVEGLTADLKEADRNMVMYSAYQCKVRSLEISQLSRKTLMSLLCCCIINSPY